MSNREKVINDLQTQIEELEERLTIALEGQPEIVRCKDCRKHGDIGCPLWTDAVEWEIDDDWFCADGKRKEKTVGSNGR